MKNLFSIFIIFGMFLLSVNQGFSANFDCCYDGFSITPTSKGSCVGEGVVVIPGVPDFGACLDLGKDSNKLSCVKGGKSYCSVSGKLIFNSDVVKNQFSDVCDNFNTFDESSCIDTSIPVDPGTGDGDGEGDGSDGDSDGTGEDYFSDDDINLFNTKCANGGKFLNLYVNKDSCESVVLPGDGNKCIFNPYLGGKVKSFFENSQILGIVSFEKESCVVDKALRRCSDLKNQNLCEGSDVESLAGTCRWVESNEFTTFDDADGLCVSKEISDTKYYNKKDYYYSTNVVKDSSFENGAFDWEHSNGNFFADENLAFHNFIGYNFGDGSSVLKQRLLNITTTKSYQLTFNYRVLKNSGVDAKLEVFLGGENILTIPANSVSEENFGVYQNYFITVKPTSITPVLEFRTSGFEKSSQIDAISFNIYDSYGPISDSSFVYNPVNILPKEASNCNLCFTDLGFNFCNQEKSDLLGSCSYMVDNSREFYGQNVDTRYLGIEENIYLQEENKWSSQSMDNSELFCELYLSKDSCEDSDNFVNKNAGSSHFNLNGNLCKWKDLVGCYKDSNGDNSFDTIYNYPKLINRPNELDDWKFSDSYYYQRGINQLSSLKLGVSDFALSCDVVAPNVYVSLKGSKADGSITSIGIDDGGDIVGNVYLTITASDAILDSCKNVNFENYLYIEFELDNGKTLSKEIRANQFYLEPTLINEFLVDSAGNSLIDGASNLKIRIYDQSGNLGKVWNFDLTIDNQGPTIDLSSPDNFAALGQIIVSSQLVSLDQQFDFIFTDKTKVDRCNYNLIAGDGANAGYYKPNGNISFTPAGYVETTFDLPIYNSSSNGDGYFLGVECFDIFNQSTSVNIMFTIDTSTELVLVEPQSFVSYLGKFGFLNETKKVILTSSDRNLVVCRLQDFDNLKSDLVPFTIVEYNSEVHDELLGNSVHDEIKKVIFGEIGFSQDGIYKGNYYCEDNSGNYVLEEHTYYYDTENPYVTEYDVLFNEDRKYVSDDGKIYLLAGSDNNFLLNLNLTADGTGSWIDKDVKLNYVIGTGVDKSYLELADVDLINDDLNGTRFTSNIRVKSNIDSSFFSGEEVSGQKGLRKYVFDVGLYDKAGNLGFSEVEFYYDISKPFFNFSGDIVDLDNTDNLIFTKVENPNVEVLFTSPDYREFKCDVYLQRGNVKTPKKSFEQDSSFSFRISDLDSKNWFENYGEVFVSVECFDIFGIRLQKDFNLIYDNTPLDLIDVSLAKGNELYSRLGTNYQPVIDGIKFTFNNTQELGGYMCEYRFKKVDNFYNCFANSTKLSKFSSLTYTSPLVNIISGGDSVIDDFSSGFQCVRSSLFDSYENLAFNNGVDLNTDLALEVKCLDGVGFSDSMTVPISYDYLSGGLISFEYKYVDSDKVSFIVKSLVDYSNIKISYTEDGENSVMDLSSPKSVGEFFVYESLGFPVTNFTEGTFTLFAVAFDNGFADGFIETEFFIDKTNPIVNLTILDVNEDSEIYQDIFKLDIDALDEVSGLDTIELFVNNELVGSFNESDYELFSVGSNVTLSDFSSANYFEGGKKFSSSVLFGKAKMNSIYVFKLVVKDNVGRETIVEKSVKYVDGIYFNLQDSINAVVYNRGYGWLTKTSAPIIKFNTSKYVTCRLESNRQGYIFEGGPNNEFEFNLAEVAPGFDLKALGNQIDFKISCSNDEATYKFTRSLFLNDKLLDYVLIPEFGFLINERPYVFEAEIKSVGPFNKMTCSYDLAGQSYGGLIMENGRLPIVINFTGFSKGFYNLDLSCVDAIGNFGPKKTYVFDVDINGDLFIDESSLVLRYKDGYESRLNGGNQLFIHSTSGVDLKFNVNKKQYVTCEYGVDPIDGILSGIVNFFRGLFGVERYQTISNSPYEFSATGLNFNDGENDLEVLCYDVSGNRFSETYQVSYVNKELDVSAQRVEN